MRYVTTKNFEEIIEAVQGFCGFDESKPVHVLTVDVCGQSVCSAMTRKDGDRWINSQPDHLKRDLYVITKDAQTYVWRKSDEQKIIEGALCIS